MKPEDLDQLLICRARCARLERSVQDWECRKLEADSMLLSRQTELLRLQQILAELTAAALRGGIVEEA